MRAVWVGLWVDGRQTNGCVDACVSECWQKSMAKIDNIRCVMCENFSLGLSAAYGMEQRILGAFSIAR